MKAGDLLVVGLTALATVAVSELFISPALVANADQDEYKVVATVTPKLAIDGVELSLQTNKTVYHPGDKPVVTLKAVNSSSEPVDLKVKTRMLAMSPASEFSRRVSLPMELWKQDCLVELKPGEMKTFTFQTGTAVQKGKAGYFEIQAGNRNVTVAAFSAPAPKLPGGPNAKLANQFRRGFRTVSGSAAGNRS